MFWSSRRWRVSTDTDCGVWRRVWGILPMVTAPVVYEPLCSVVSPRRSLEMLVAPSSRASPMSTAGSSRKLLADFCCTCTPLPCNSSARAWALSWLPDTPAVVLPCRLAASYDRFSPPWRAICSSAASRGPAGMFQRCTCWVAAGAAAPSNGAAAALRARPSKAPRTAR